MLGLLLARVPSNWVANRALSSSSERISWTYDRADPKAVRLVTPQLSEKTMSLLYVAADCADCTDWCTRLSSLGFLVSGTTAADAALTVHETYPHLIILGPVGNLETRIDLAQRLTESAQPAVALVLLGPHELPPSSADVFSLRIDFLQASAPLELLEQRIHHLLALVALRYEHGRAAEMASPESRALIDAFQEIGQALSGTLELDRLMDVILESVERIIPHDASTIMQIYDGFARVTHTRHYPNTVAPRIEQLDFSLDQPTIRTMLASDKALLVSDVHADPNWLQMGDLHWIGSYCGISLRVKGEVVAILNLDSNLPNAFTQIHVERLQAFALQASIAIENARLYEALRQDTMELNLLHRATSFLFSNELFTQRSIEDVGLKIARTVVDEFGQIDCGVLLLDSRSSSLIRLARTGRYDVKLSKPMPLDGPGLVPAAVRSGQPVYAPDVLEDPRYVPNVASTRSELALPLITSNGVIGALDLQSTDVDAFSEQSRRILMSFAEQAAVAIENIKLYDEIRRYSVELEDRVRERTAELNRVKDRAEAILNNSNDAIIMARIDGTIQQTNRAFGRLFHYEVDAAFGRPLSALARLDYAEMLSDALQEAVDNARPVRVEVVAVTTDGGSFDADMVISPVQQGAASVSSVVCSIRDITARKRIEKELRRSLERERELNDMKSRFISTASHEFRTPLAMIMTSSDLLLNYASRMSEQDRHDRLLKIQAEVRNITALLDDLLTVSRASHAGKAEFNPVYVDLPALCLKMLQEVRTGIGAGHHFEVVMRGEEREAWIDEKLLRRVLTNLLSNAIKYSPKGSTIHFELHCAAETKMIRIADEGIGIPEKDRRNLFEAFHRGGNVGTVAGTGLGLTIVKHAVDLHSGTIDVSSGVNSGTVFTLNFPAVLPKEGVDAEDSRD